MSSFARLRSHLHTVIPRLRHAVRPERSPAAIPFSSEIEDPRFGAIPITGRLCERAGDTLVVLLHGLGGCTESAYLLRAARAVDEAGLSGLRLNLRGSDRGGHDFYHAGLTADLHAALASPDLVRFRRIFVLGFSLGGHVALRAATEAQLSERVVAVAAVSAPLDLTLGSAAIDAPRSWLYRKYLLAHLKEIYEPIAARRPELTPFAAVRDLDTLRAWDRAVVAPRHGFRDELDYYQSVSVGSRLGELRRPALWVHARHDPMVPRETVAPSLERSFPNLEVRWVERAGHCGFPAPVDLRLGVQAPRTIERQVLGWLMERGSTASREIRRL